MKRCPDHIVMNAKTQVLECMHCGQSVPLRFPISIAALDAIDWLQAFTKSHRDCRARASEGQKP